MLLHRIDESPASPTVRPDSNWTGCQPHAGGSSPRDIRRRARQPRTYTRPYGCSRNTAFLYSGRCGTACWPRRWCPTGTEPALRARWCIRLLAESRARPARKPEPTAATKGKENPTARLAQGPERNPLRAWRPSLGAYGIGPETAARFGRRSFPPPWRLSIGSRTASSRFESRTNPRHSARKREPRAATTGKVSLTERWAPTPASQRGWSGSYGIARETAASSARWSLPLSEPASIGWRKPA
jgi:hypothetical protein